jgi:hypothetical protein
MKSLVSIFASPVACLVILGGVVAENRTHIKPQDASPYHAAVRARLEAWPEKIQSPGPGEEEWNSRPLEVPEAAVQLLRPNALVSRHYECLEDPSRNFNLLIVQCGEPSDMSGHYPPNCYPSNGQPLARKPEPRQWRVGGTTIDGVEYHFEPRKLGQSRLCVYNFFVLPGRGVEPNMEEVRRASADYRRRYYGAAQFQVIFSTDLPRETRDAIFTAVIGADPGIFQVLNPPGL